MNTGCIVLAGGDSLRLGRDKVLEVVGESTLLQRVISRISFLNSDIIVVTAEKRFLPEVDYPRLKIIADAYPGKGSLGGIYSGLAASHLSHNLVVACDMPFLSQALIRYMTQLADDFDIVVPRVGNLFEPLHAIYSKDCLEPIERLLKKGTLKVDALFGLVKVRYVEAAEINDFDPKRLSFFNVNTEADLEKAQEIVNEELKL